MHQTFNVFTTCLSFSQRMSMGQDIKIWAKFGSDLFCWFLSIRNSTLLLCGNSIFLLENTLVFRAKYFCTYHWIIWKNFFEYWWPNHDVFGESLHWKNYPIFQIHLASQKVHTDLNIEGLKWMSKWSNVIVIYVATQTVFKSEFWKKPPRS